MNDRLRDALEQLNSDVPEVGVWEEIQGRVTARRRRKRAIQGVVGVVAVLVIGLGASGLLRGTEGPDFVERPTTTAVETTTTTSAASTTTVTGRAIEAVDVTTVEGPVWAAYVFVGSDVGLPEAGEVRTALGRMGITGNNGLLVEATVHCDIGIPENLYESSRNQFMAVYFADQQAAFDFATAFSATLAVAEVEHTCSPEDRLVFSPQPSSRVVAPLSPWYTVARTITVYGELGDDVSVSVGGEEPGILEETYFETEIELAPGVNQIEVRFVGEEVTIETLEITRLEDAFDLFVFIDDFSGELVFDEAEFLTGEAANEAAREAGEIGEGETVPNDFFIRNADPTLSSLAVADYAVISLLGFDEEGGITPILVDRDEFEAMVAGDFDPGDWYGGDPRALPYWLIIEGYRIVQIEQQYLP